jgi:hypothetical protein
MTFKRGGNTYKKLGLDKISSTKEWIKKNNRNNFKYDIYVKDDSVDIEVDGDLVLYEPPKFKWEVKIKTRGYIRFITLPPPSI